MIYRILTLTFMCFLLITCATNPVTGEKELYLVPESKEIEIGEQNYFPTQQSQGGQYVTDPKITQYINSVGQRLAKASDRPNLPYEFVVLNNSVPNAWALPGGKIAVNRGLLLELENEAELAAVLGHEIVHAAARHGAKSMERGMLLGVSIAALGVALHDNKNAPLIVGGAALGSTLISTKYGRDAELESDLYGIKYMSKAGYNPIAAVTLQEKFVQLSQGQQSNWLTGLFASHPPSQERVDTNKKTTLSLGNKGELNTEGYKQQLASLIKLKPAYDALEQGQKALAQDDPNTALSLAEKALKMQPKEGLFHALKADALAKLNDLKKAEISYTSAINTNPQYFLFYLQRGLVREQLKNDMGAKQDLTQSIQLLPTTTAHYALGNIALRQNDTQTAKEHFAIAGNNDSEIGKKAARSFARLDLPANPNKYLATQLQLDKYNKLFISVQNTSPVAVKDIAFVITVSLAGNQINQENLTFSKTINPGDTQSIVTQITTIPGKTTLNDITVKIVKLKILN